MCWFSLPREGHHSGAGCDVVEVWLARATWMDLLFPNTANAYCPEKCFCWRMNTCRYVWQNPGSRTTSHRCCFSFKVFRIFLQMCMKTWFLLSSLIHYSSSHLFGYSLIKHMLCLRDQISFDHKTLIWKDVFTSFFISPEGHFPSMALIETESAQIPYGRLGSKLWLYLHQAEAVCHPLHNEHIMAKWPEQCEGLAINLCGIETWGSDAFFLLPRGCFPSSW